MKSDSASAIAIHVIMATADKQSNKSVRAHSTCSSSSNSSRYTEKLRQNALAREIELAAQVKVAREQNLQEDRKREIENKLMEDEVKEEEDEGVRRAQELIRSSQERAARIRRRQEWMNEQEEIKRKHGKQEEIKLETEYKAAREITLMYEQEENLGSAS